jgi:uncharacterized membrane protein YhiD involved in acid resistance
MNFEETISQFMVHQTVNISIFEVLLAMILPFILSIVIAMIYKKNIDLKNFNKDTFLAIILFSVFTSVITLVIGSNIARAFGLVGALSVIRFRTAIKSPLEIIYIFWALCVGMACGVGYYGVALITVVMGGVFLKIIQLLNLAELDFFEVLVKVETKIETNALNSIFEKHSKSFECISTIVEEVNRVSIYKVILSKKMDSTALANELSQSSEVLDAKIISTF